MDMDLKVPIVILCGGKGTRIGLLSQKIPKPLIKIGDKPIVWHVMKIYASWGFRNFVLCLGYKGNQVKEYFKRNNAEGWNIRCVDTGIDATKSERLAKVKDLINNKYFFLAYGDDVADINLPKLFKFHLKSKRIATITAVRMVSEFGILKIDKGNIITNFKEKPLLKEWINGGFMVLDKKIFDYIGYGELEKEIFKKLSEQKKIAAYKHKGGWRAMNTLKDNIELNFLWNNGKAFWKIW